MVEELQTRLGAQIRKLRKRCGLTQAQLSEKIGVSDEFLSRMERGLKAPSLHTAEKISVALGTSLKGLFDFEDVGPGDKRAVKLDGLIRFLSTEDAETLNLVDTLARAAVRHRKGSAP